MDRIDKVLLVLPFLPAADLLSTLFSLGRGGQEVGVLARLVLEGHGAYGLVLLALSACIMFLVYMLVVIRIKGLFVKEWKFRWTKRVLTISICWFFVLEGLYVSTVVMNLLVSLSLEFVQTIPLRVLLVLMYFACACRLTLPQIRQFPCM